MCVFVGPTSCMNTAGCCRAGGDTAFDAPCGPNHKHVLMFAYMLVLVFTWLLCGIPYKASTRSAALFKITS